MKLYSEEKEMKVWNKYELMGERKFVVFTTLLFTGCLLIPLIILYIFFHSLFGLPDYGPVKLVLLLLIYMVIVIFIGLKISSEIWIRGTIGLNGITGIVSEINDDELKNLILKGEKIKAVKRYKIITGAGLKESIRYVDLISEYYINYCN